MLAVFTVNSLLDNGDGAKTTLREAIVAANVDPDFDIIEFSTNLAHGLSGGTITLTQGELTITDSVTINATMLSSILTIHAGGGTNGVVGNFDGHSVFNIVGSAGDVEINGFTLTGGDTPGFGGAIYSGANLTVKNSVITGNASQNGGGGIDSNGNLNVENSTISGNNTAGMGGGIAFFTSTGTLNVVSSTISGNHGDSGGGGIRAFGYSGSANIQSSHITGNRSYLPGATGGGISAYLQHLAIHSTKIRDNSFEINSISGNTYGGGGLYASASNGSITIDGSIIDDNRTEGSTGFNSIGGGAFLKSNNSEVTITNTTISNNRALGQEANIGGINITANNNSTVLIDRVKITGNHADDDVGGLYIKNQASVVTVRNTTISGNTANDNAGSNYDAAGGAWIGTYDGGTNNIEHSTISGNEIVTTSSLNDSGKRAGGLFLANNTGTTTTILNSTISGNVADGFGGGIKISENTLHSGGVVNIRHSTITHNRADSNDDTNGQGGGIHVGSSSTTVFLDHTIVAGNWRGSGTTTRDDIVGSVTAGWSLIGDNTGATITTLSGTSNQIGTSASPINPNLGLLAWNGGPTVTHALLSGSRAIDAGNPAAVAGVGDVPINDQRGPGFPRVADVPGVNGSTARVDIGAYEVGLARVIDVVLNGVQVDASNIPWTRDPISYAELVPQGKQFAPIFTEGVNSIQILFSEPVQTLAPSDLTLYGTGPLREGALEAIDETAFNSTTNTWTFDVLAGDKYRIDMLASDVLDMYGRPLNGYWANDNGGTFDVFTDDPPAYFPSGNDDLAGSSFQFMFSLLPGDYDQNGTVDAGDFTVYSRDDIPFDGNGDEIETAADFDIWDAHFNDLLFLTRRTGDYSNDEMVGLADYVTWRTSYGSTSILVADGSNNGVVDAADFTLWRYWENTIGAWYLSPSGVGSLLPIVDFGNAPRVANVTISGSTSTHDPYSFDAHDGSGDSCGPCPWAARIRSPSRSARM